jgi:hypothetical protein
MTTPDQDTRHADLAAKLLARAAADDEAGPATLPDRAANVAAIERALRARRHRRLAPWFALGAAAAAAVLVPLGWHNLRTVETAPAPVAVPAGGEPHRSINITVAAVEGSGASIETLAGPRPAARGDRIAAGTSVHVPGAGHLLLALDTGTQLRVGASSRVRLTSLGTAQRFDVDSGTLEADVAKVPAGGRFVVATRDAEVEVKGTRFEVAVASSPSTCAPFVRTQVTVQEGAVAVRFAGGEVRVAAGSVWPACPPPSPAVHGTRNRARPARQPAPSPEVAAPAARTPEHSTLAEQNDLLAAALSARRRGDLGEAIRWLDRLIARYPNGQLIDSARAERRRLVDLRAAKAPPE